MAASSGRKGRPWRRARDKVFDAHGDLCHLCGHGGAANVDHVIPKDMWIAMGGDPEDPANLRPAHGANSRCPVCHRCCNQVKGDRLDVVFVQGSRDW